MLSLEHFFVIGDTPYKLINGHYDLPLVTLSLIIAIGASYMALTLAAAARRSGTLYMERLHLSSGALSLGFGVWSMHFIGMLAFEIPNHVHYDPGITALSALPSLLASWVALSLLARHDLTGLRLVCGGVAVGAGIGAMHYMGMAAMEIGPALRYDPMLFALSIVVAVLLGTVALWISVGLRQKTRMRGYQRRLLAGVVMGLAIAGMHYTAMEAARFIGEPDPDFLPGSARHTTLALIIAFVTTALSLLAAGVNAVARYRALMQRSMETASELRTIVDAAVDGIVKISDRGIVLSFNDSASRIFGYSAQEVVGNNVKMLMASPHHENHDDYLKHYLHTGERKIIGSGREVWAQHKRGHQIPIRLAIGESRLGGISTFVGFISDISERYQMETDLRRAKDEAVQAAAAKSAFLANMSHEIRTPMNAIIGFTDLVLDTPLEAPQARHLGIVKTSARSLLALLNDILDTAKLDGGHTVLESRDFCLRSVCEQIVATQSLNAANKGLQLTLDYQAGDYFKGDPLRIQQVVLNLLSNAVKFTLTGGVTLRVQQPDASNVVILVEDTGIGIPADRISTIFEPFTQADSSMTRRFGGTGLGTTIARQLTELMGGQITVTSTPGEGSTFCVTLPLQPAESAPDETHPGRETPLPALTILVADDVPQNLELLSTLLSQRGHRVITASNGQQALDCLEQQSVDLVLMDVQMPEMNGHDATRRLRARETQQSLARTPVVALTASILEEDRRQAADAGMDGFAIKPINLPELTAEMGRILGVQTMTTRPDRKHTQTVVDPVLVSQLWPDRSAHQYAAQQFLTASANHPDSLFSTTDHEDALAWAHRLRGLAGNLGFTLLAKAASDIEHTLKKPGLISQQQRQQLTQQFVSARAWLDEQGPFAPEPAHEPGASDELDVNALTALIDQLRQGEIPDQAFASLRNSLPTACSEAAADALENFEPEKAAELLSAFRESLGDKGC